MGMTPDIYLQYFVDSNAYDCSESPGDVRRAFNAAVSASHFADHFFAYSKRHNPDAVSQYSKLGSFVEHLSQVTDGAFRDIRSIANAYKHLYTDVGEASTYCNVSSSGSIDSVEVSDDDHLENIAEEFFDDATDKGSRRAVVFTRKDGTTSEFLPTLEKVVAHFSTMLWQTS